MCTIITEEFDLPLYTSEESYVRNKIKSGLSLLANEILVVMYDIYKVTSDIYEYLNLKYPKWKSDESLVKSIDDYIKSKDDIRVSEGII